MEDTSAARLCKIAVASNLDSQLRTCLYVEDSQADALLVKQLIARRNDLVLLTADTGPLGLKMALDHRPDIIFLDINLPGASGLDVLAALRNDPLTAQIPVTALSSNAYPGQIEEGLRSGFFRYLTKPFKLAEFMAAIDGMLPHARKIAAVCEPTAVKKHRHESAAG